MTVKELRAWCDEQPDDDQVQILDNGFWVRLDPDDLRSRSLVQRCYDEERIQ